MFGDTVSPNKRKKKRVESQVQWHRALNWHDDYQVLITRRNSTLSCCFRSYNDNDNNYCLLQHCSRVAETVTSTWRRVVEHKEWRSFSARHWAMHVSSGDVSTRLLPRTTTSTSLVGRWRSCVESMRWHCRQIGRRPTVGKFLTCILAS